MSSQGSYYPKSQLNSGAGANSIFAGAYDPRLILVPALRGSRFFQLDRSLNGPIHTFRKLDNNPNSFAWEIEDTIGPPGPPGPAGVNTDLYAADLSVQIGDAVHVDQNGTLFPALASDSEKKFCIGIAVSKPSPMEADVLSVGRTTDLFTGLTPNQPIFLDPVNTGEITQTPPTGANVWLQTLGMAVTPSKIHLQIQAPIKRA